MQEYLVLATAHGVVMAQRDDTDWREFRRGLIDEYVTSVIAREGVILAGTTNGVFRSDDVGQTWCASSAGLALEHVRWLAYHPDVSDREFAGTEPAGIFVSHDGAQTWRACEEVAQLRDRHHWMLPYSPEAGCVRGFAFHGSRAYAAVEVGGVLRSIDSGETWHLAEGSAGKPDLEGPPELFVYPDVHSVVVHPSSPDVIFLGVPWPQHMVERFFQIDDELWAVLSNGDLLVTSLTARAWRKVLVNVKDVTALAAFATLAG